MLEDFRANILKSLKLDFSKILFGYSLCMMADFQNGLISQIFSAFSSGFSTEQLEMICRMAFDMFFGILTFDPK